MSVDNKDEGYLPTDSTNIVDLTNRTGKVPTGYVCSFCGHLATSECEIIGFTCPKCLQEWLIKKNVPQLVSITAANQESESALVPTIIMKKHKVDENATTQILPPQSTFEEFDTNGDGI